MSGLRQLLRRSLTAALPAERFMTRGPGQGVALTFDDGPDPDITPQLLDALAREQVHATFFLVGARMEMYPALVQRIAAEGHLIGHHSWSHSEPAITPTATLLAEVRRCRELLASLIGIDADRFRPPKGQLTATKLAALLRERQRVVLWSLDPKDYQMTASDELLRWSQSATFRAGDIVLLHDVKPHCVAALHAITAQVRRAGQALVTLDAWLPPQRSAA